MSNELSNSTRVFYATGAAAPAVVLTLASSFILIYYSTALGAPPAIVGGALASRDYTPVHHDRGAAQAQGLSDVIMNILTTNGYVGRYVTDWAGSDAVVKELEVKLGAPNMPMRFE